MTAQTRLERYEQRTEWPLAAVALLFLALYSVQVLAVPQAAAAHQPSRTAWCLCIVVFVVDYLVRLWLAEPRGSWFVRHLFDLPIVVLPFLRPLRLLSLAVVINLLQRAIGHTIRGRVIIYTVCGAVLIVYAASLAIIDVERDQPESAIKRSAMRCGGRCATVTTGYGDLGPLTAEGRMVAVALMIGGISCSASSLRHWLPGSCNASAEEDTANQAATAAQIDELREEIRRLAKSVRRERRRTRQEPSGR